MPTERSEVPGRTEACAASSCEMSSPWGTKGQGTGPAVWQGCPRLSPLPHTLEGGF